jgi:hypothetical protein
MSTLKLDQSSDYSNKEIYSLLRDVDLPMYVKTAELDDHDTLQNLPKEAFAEPSRKIYPLNTPARTYVSNAFFGSKKAEMSKIYGAQYTSQIESSIKEAAEIFGISADLERYNNRLEKNASRSYTTRHLGEFELDGTEIKLYATKTAQDLIENAEHLNRHLKNYPFDWRVKMAQATVKLASKLSVDDIPDRILKYAGMYYPDFEKISSELWRRATKLKNPQHVEIYNKLAEDVQNITTVEEVMKLAETLHNIENMEGLYDNVKTAGILGDPVDAIFTKSIVKVAEDLSFVEAHGDKYRIDDLQKAAKNSYMEAFGIDMSADSAEKLAEVFPTMPRADIKLFEEITGIRPI